LLIHVIIIAQEWGLDMLRIENKQLSLGCLAYQKIPEDHILKLVDKAVDFSFINELLADSYCLDDGRPAKEPALMAKLLFLQHLYNLSDVKVIEEATFNLVWLWFLGLNPEDELPDPSLLAKFRTQRLKEHSLDDIPKEKVIFPWDGIKFDPVTHQITTGRGIIVQIQDQKYVPVWPFDIPTEEVLLPIPKWNER
jgi:transposase